jgi:hypothetical protein
MTAGKSNVPKYKAFFSPNTSLFTKFAVLFLLLHFILTSPQNFFFPQSFEAYLEWAYIPTLVSITLDFLAWLSALTAALLTVFGRKNLGFLFALGLALLSGVASVIFLVQSGEWILSNFLEIEPLGIVSLLSTFVILPVGLILLVLGRPEVRRLGRNKA